MQVRNNDSYEDTIYRIIQSKAKSFRYMWHRFSKFAKTHSFNRGKLIRATLGSSLVGICRVDAESLSDTTPNNVILDTVLILFESIWFLFGLERGLATFHFNFLFLYSSPLLILEKCYPPVALNSQNPVLKFPLLPNSHTSRSIPAHQCWLYFGDGLVEMAF